MEKRKIIISSCLLNNIVRYDGKILNFTSPVLEKMKITCLLIPFCPEVEGGLPIPRIPSELSHSATEVFETQLGIVNNNGEDVTQFFINGVKKIDDIIKNNVVEFALLKENSPSCGVNYIYDGSFLGKLKPGEGIFAYYLRLKEIEVYSEKEIYRLEQRLK